MPDDTKMDKKFLYEITTDDCCKMGDSDKKFPLNTPVVDFYGPGDPRPDYDVPSLKCPGCGANMVRRLAPGICISSPPKRELQWWCKCGITRTISYEDIPGFCCDKPPEEAEWEEANRGKEVQHA